MRYKLTSKTIEIVGYTLYQIEYSDGSLGGFIESESNLSQEGKAQVYGNAQVYADARVYGNAQVSDKNQCITITSFTFPITALPKGVQIGYLYKSYAQWMTVLKSKAVKLGLNPSEYSILKKLLPLLKLQTNKKS